MHPRTRRRRAVAVVAAHPCCRIRFPFSWWGSKRRVTGGWRRIEVSPLSGRRAAVFAGSFRSDRDAARANHRAKVTLHGDSGALKSTVADNNGSYAFAGVTPGDYTVQASAPELSLAQPAKVTLLPGAQTLNLTLQVSSLSEKVTVQDTSGQAL